jgi:heme/copper-type cytochrome/quinol oxidase subunit 3
MPRSATAAAVKLRPVPIRRPAFGEGPPGGGGSGREETFIGNGQLAILMLLAAESMLFSGLIGSFLVYRLGSAFWPPPGLPRLPIAVTWVNTFVLLSSALTMKLAMRSARVNRLRALKGWLIITALLGTTFLGVQGSEWVRLVAHGLYISSGTYGATFYTLIGCHAVHVIGATIWLLCVVALAIRGRYNAVNHSGVEVCAIYWYFVCAVWPVLFVLVYL